MGLIQMTSAPPNTAVPQAVLVCGRGLRGLRKARADGEGKTEMAKGVEKGWVGMGGGFRMCQPNNAF